MKHRGIIAMLAAVLAIGAAWTVTTQAQPGPDRARTWRAYGGTVGMRGLGLPGLRQLDLTDAQVEQIRTIQQSHRDEGRQIAERMRTAQRELNAAAEGTTVDEPTIRARADALAAALADSTLHRAKVNAEIFSVLSTEQQEQLKTLRAAAEARMKQRAAERQQRRRQFQVR
jgi:Spy/CpxP family protein refolding chaperone